MSVHIRDGDAITVKRYVTYKFEGASISQYQVSDADVESIWVGFKKMTYKYER